MAREIRREPIFGLPTPLLFAHRGGVREAPESTVKGFTHALEARADVLELDVHLTKDGAFVVWHGPELYNVRIEGQSDHPSKRPDDRKKIYDYDWRELHNKAWVADPEIIDLPEDEIDLSAVAKDEDRLLLLLSEFMEKFPSSPLNIEMKVSFRRRINDTNQKGLRDNVRKFSDILDAHSNGRGIVVVSSHDEYLDEFRELNGDKYATGQTPKEHLSLGLITSMKNRALETSYSRLTSSKIRIKRVRHLGGSSFVFLTSFGPIPSIDIDPQEEDIFEILDRGVDGIMTDRPKRLREIMDKWQQSH